MKNKLIGRGERAFSFAAFTVMLILAILAFYPFLLIIMASFTDEISLLTNGYSLFPKEFSAVAYQYLAANSSVILRAYGVSILVTGLGTMTGFWMTAMLAYPMSRKDFKYRNVLAFFVFFTLLFNGGVTPSYMMWTNVFHINNTILALIIPNFLMNGFHVMLMRNYFQNSVPVEIIESAKLDGGNEFTILLRIILPLSVPVSATVGLFMGIAYWNDWINGLYYIDKPQLFGIQNLLIRMMNNIQFLSSGQAAAMVDSSSVALPSTGVRMAMAVIGVLPILIVYPLLQKYLIKGVVMGAVKG